MRMTLTVFLLTAACLATWAWGQPQPPPPASQPKGRPFIQFKPRPGAKPRRPTSGPASQPLRRGAASAPVRTPDEEAELAMRLAEVGRNNEALEMARSAFQRSERPGLALLAMATTYDAKGRSYEAMEYLRKYLDLPQGRNDWRGHALKGSIFLRTQSYNMALKTLQEAQKLVPRDKPVAVVSVASNLAETLLRLKKREEAEKTIRAARGLIQNEPNVALWLAYGRVLFSCTGLTPDVEQALRVAAGLADHNLRQAAPDDPAPTNELLSCFKTYLDVFEAEIAEIDRAEEEGRELDPAKMRRRPELLGSLAMMSIQTIDIQRRARLIDALKYCRRAERIDDKNVEVLMTMAEIQIQLNDGPGAMQALQRLLAVKPDHADAVELLKRLRAAAAATAPASAEPPAPGMPPSPATSSAPSQQARAAGL